MSYTIVGNDIVITLSKRRSPSSRWKPAGGMTKLEVKTALMAGRPAVECHYCGCRLTAATATIDHIRPRSRGGNNTLSNFLLACAPCNNRRGDMSYATFVRKVAA